MNELYVRKRKMPPGSSTHCHNMNAGPSRVRLALTGFFFSLFFDDIADVNGNPSYQTDSTSSHQQHRQNC